MSRSYEEYVQRKRHQRRLRELTHWCVMAAVSLGTLSVLGGVIWRAWS